jgi:tetratricopeptide (TPR) repeat protein
MSDNPQPERPTRAPTPTWVQLLRPVLVLICFIIGFVAFHRVVIRGTVFDGMTPPAWSKDGIDISTARDAARRADFEEATRILKQLIMKQPNHAEAHQMLGRIYLQTGDRTRALEHYQVALSCWPGDRESERAVEILRVGSFGQDGAANRSQPIHLETNGTSWTAGSDR